MAITIDRSVITIGDQNNRKQGILHIPAETTAEKPGLLIFGNLQAASASLGGNVVMWADSGNNIRIHTSIPTDEDSDGNTLTTGAVGATPALDNLASVAINTALISDADNTDDLGSSANQWKDLYINGTAHVDQHEGDLANFGRVAGVGANYIKIIADGVTTLEGTATIDGVGTGNFLDKSATETVSGAYTFSNAGGITASGAAGVVSDVIGERSAGSGVTIDSLLIKDQEVYVGTDNKKVYFGSTPATDSYIFFDGAGNLTFYDTAVGANVTLATMAGSNLASPTITGDPTISDGILTWNDLTDEVAGTWTFSNITNDSIDVIANSATTGNIIHIQSTSLTSGTGVRVDTAEATLAGGLYFEAYDTTAPAIVWQVAEDGNMTIAGTASGTDAITITAGDITLTSGDSTLTDGDYVITEGKITVDTVTNESSYIKRNQAVTTTPVFEIEETATAADNPALLVDHNPTGDINAIEVATDGTGFGLSITSSAAGGRGIEYISTAGTDNGVLLDGVTNTWVGAADKGFLKVESDGTLANADAHLVLLDLTGGGAAASADGALLKLADNAAAGSGYAMAIASSGNLEALHVSAGEVVLDEKLSVNDDVLVTIADNDGVDAITIDQNDITQDKDGLVITVAGDGSPIKVTAETATSGSSQFITAASQTTSAVIIDGTAGNWIGAQDVGMLHLHGDGTHAHADASMLYIDMNGTSASGQLGIGLHIDTAGVTSGGGTEYAAYINAGANAEALKVDSGVVLVDETLTATLGLVTAATVNNVTNPPTNAECDTAFASLQIAGGIGFINDANLGTNEYLVVHDGTDWWYLTLTKCA